VKYVTPLNETESQTLYEMHRYHPSRRARMRAHRLLLRHQAVSMPHMARIDQVDRRSVSTWIDRWQPRGFVGFYDQPGAGRRPLLSVDEPHQVHQSLQPYPKDFKRVVPPLEPQTYERSQDVMDRLHQREAAGAGDLWYGDGPGLCLTPCLP
jgi:hypothetical protein